MAVCYVSLSTERLLDRREEDAASRACVLPIALEIAEFDYRENVNETRRAQHTTVICILASVVCIAGCEATIGPYVTDIQQKSNGDLVVIRCTTKITRSGNIDSYATGDCTEKIIQQVPASSSAAATGVPAAPPAAQSSGTLIR